LAGPAQGKPERAESVTIVTIAPTMATREHRIPPALEEGLAVACMALLVVITLGNVLTRYLTDESFAWTEEISIFLMVLMTLAGASAAAARDRHIRIEYFYEGGSASRQTAFKIVAACIAGLLFLGLAALFARVVADEIRYAETSMGLGIPRWWFTVFSPLLCLAIALRSFGVAWRAARAEPGAAR
jgi:TRAP-type C4-dicarboxylate transport system permease small subunit